MFEDADVDGEGRLIVRCEGPEEAADLSRPECLRAVLKRCLEAPDVRGVVLVHDREKAYGARAMAVLGALLRVARLLDQFSARAPSPAFPGFTAKEVEALCARCEFRPEALFSRLQDAVLGDPDAFLEALQGTATALDAYAEEGCAGCAGATVQDLRILLEELAKAGA